ncbi:MAG: TonB-dependent receptor [Candidatus Aminicenantes bacterium]|nr:TonB-dependent receptor [Candidatus Aminicenantes bacterium]
MKIVKCLTVLLFLGLYPLDLPAQEKLRTEEEILVIGTRIPVDKIKINRTVFVITREMITRAPVRTVTGLLQSILSVDVRQRAPLGVQGDLSIRGSKFTQVQILIDGIKVHDPQTAHHNLDLPLSLADIERIEVLNGQGSTTYGENAIGGVVNIITRKPTDINLSAEILAGQHQTAAGNLAFSFPLNKFGQSFSLDYQNSDGFMENRDFSTLNLTSLSSLELPDGHLKLVAGHNRKVFGAAGFYSPLPSREWTRTTFAGLSAEWKETTVKAHFRQHYDRFMLDVERPEYFQSEHTGLSYGLEGYNRFSIHPGGRMAVGAEIRSDSITSLTLGDHSYRKLGLFTEYSLSHASGIFLSSGLRADLFSSFGSEISPSLALGYVFSSRSKIRFSIGKAFRIPTFTELHYNSPANIGNPDLKAERSLSVEAGFDAYPMGNMRWETTLFYRRDRDLIDWIRYEDAAVWLAENIRAVDFFGLESGFFYKNWNISYTFLHSWPDSPQKFISKYVLNHPVHHLTAGWRIALPLRLRMDLNGTFKQRKDARAYATLDVCISRVFKNVEGFLRITNLTDIRYEEIPGVPMPGRWFLLGFRFN